MVRIDNTIPNEMPNNNVNSNANNTGEIKSTGPEPVHSDRNTDEKSVVATSRDGDTLEISKKISSNELLKCSKTKLKQLLSSGKITKQQYEKVMKKYK